MSSQFPGTTTLAADTVRLAASAYWVVFAAAFLSIAWWESRRPSRPLTTPEHIRWTRHGLLFSAAYISVWIVWKTSPVAMSLVVAASGSGLLGNIAMPALLRALIAICLLDLVRYGTHRLYHAIPLLWRIHRVHHSDPDYDVSTGARFHPLEVVLTNAIYMGAIMLLGPPPGAVLVVELVTCFQNFFVHANAALPHWLESRVRLFVLTPDLHRVHHSAVWREQQTNYGEIFSWWDRLCSTWQAEPSAGRTGWQGGLGDMPEGRDPGAGALLAMPFRPMR